MKAIAQAAFCCDSRGIPLPTVRIDRWLRDDAGLASIGWATPAKEREYGSACYTNNQSSQRLRPCEIDDFGKAAQRRRIEKDARVLARLQLPDAGHDLPAGQSSS